MMQEPAVVYVATYASADRATDDFACVQRLQRDGIIAPQDSAVIARETGDWAVHRSTSTHPDTLSPTHRLVGWVLSLLVPPPLPTTRGDGGDCDPAPAWMLDGDVSELREQLADAHAAVVVVGVGTLAPALQVALARATSLLDMRLTADGTQRADRLLLAVSAST